MSEGLTPGDTPGDKPRSAPLEGALAASVPEAIKASGGAPLTKIIVAIHGIGSQVRSSTVRSVACRFGDRKCPPLPVMPLGYFDIAKESQVRWSRLDTDDEVLAGIGFAEIYWADIPDQIVKANDTLEETKAWGRTVVSRAQSLYKKQVAQGALDDDDFQLGIGVVEEIIESIGVLENLLWLTKKAGLFTFELGELLRDYIGDVQIVTDFPVHREKILYRFHSALQSIVATYKQTYPGQEPEIYLVAHSEGTVISLLGLFQALSGETVVDRAPRARDQRGSLAVEGQPRAAARIDPASLREPVNTAWVSYVRGFMTIGSPIDKHIALWPKLWEKFEFDSSIAASGEMVFNGNANGLVLPQKIKWRNYFDHGDPIGFKLDAAADMLKAKHCEAFEFAPEHDYGFSHSWLPGKAHNDYWEDGEVFSHFIDDVVLDSGKAKAPVRRKMVGYLSTAIPYCATLLIHLAAVFVLYKAIAFAFQREPMRDLLSTAWTVGLLGVALCCMTFAARLPRLVKPDQFRWMAVCVLALAVMAGAVLWLPSGATGFGRLLIPSVLAELAGEELAGRLAVITAAILVSILAGWVVPRRPKWSRRALLGTGMGAVAAVVVAQYVGMDGDAPRFWPVALAGALFFYLWWLGILLFDLSFIWHRYVREAVFVQTLRSWRHQKDAKPRPNFGLGSATA